MKSGLLILEQMKNIYSNLWRLIGKDTQKILRFLRIRECNTNHRKNLIYHFTGCFRHTNAHITVTT